MERIGGTIIEASQLLSCGIYGNPAHATHNHIKNL